jgi:hypothetical protein
MAVSYNTSTVTDRLVLCLDAANKKSYSQNEFLNTTNLFTFSGTGANAATLSRDTISSPVGNTPLKMAMTGNDPHWFAYNSAGFNIAPAANGQTWIVSVYAKASFATTGEIFIFNANSAGDAFANSDYGATGVSIGTEWTRVQYVRTMNSVNTAFIQVRLDGTPSGGSGQNIWWDGLQVERVPSGVTTPTPYTSIYSGGSVFKDLTETVSSSALTNYPTYSSANNGCFVLDGTNDYIFTPRIPSIGVGQQSLTWSIWVSPSITGGGDILNMQSGLGWNMCPFWSTSQRFYAKLWQAATIESLATYTVGSWYNLVLTYNHGTTTSTFYINGVSQGTASGAYSASGYDNYLGIGLAGSQATNTYFNGRTSSLNVYNKSLSASEVSQNFNALRGRYGL